MITEKMKEILKAYEIDLHLLGHLAYDEFIEELEAERKAVEREAREDEENAFVAGAGGGWENFEHYKKCQEKFLEANLPQKKEDKTAKIPDHADPNLMDWGGGFPSISAEEKRRRRYEYWLENCRGKGCHDKPRYLEFRKKRIKNEK